MRSTKYQRVDQLIILMSYTINNEITPKLQSMIDILKIKINGVPLDISGDRMISLTFQYKELNKDIYDLFMQDQVETYIAN